MSTSDTSDTSDTTDLPKGIALTPFNDAFKTAPSEVLAAARNLCPAYYDEEFGRYVVLAHDDVRDALRDKAFYMDIRKANEGSFPKRFPEFVVADESSMLSLDDPDHKRLRGLVSKAFTPKAVEAMRPRSRAIAQELLCAISDTTEVDIIDAFAAPFPTMVICDMLGVSRDYRHDFKRWSDTSIRGFFNIMASDEEKQHAIDANENLRALFYREIAARRAHPGEDLISGMVLAQEAGERLTDDEIVTQCNLLLVAGNVTVTDMLGNAILRLLENPDQLALLRAHPTLLPNALEEALRFDPPVDATSRLPNRDIEPSGCPIKSGEYLHLSIYSANHDPAAHPDPDRFNIERDDLNHLSFGGGSHFCLGSSLARIEGQEALAALLERFPSFALGTRGFQVAMTPQFRGIESLWITESSAHCEQSEKQVKNETEPALSP